MKKIKFLILLVFISVMGCDTTKTVKYKDMHTFIKDENFEKYLNNNINGTKLIYKFTDTINENGVNYLYANFLVRNDYYVIDFENEDLFLFNKNNQVIYYFNETITEFETVNNIYDFIHFVEERKELKFRLFDYQGFDILHELLDNNNSDKMKFTRKTGGMNPSIRYIEISKVNIASFSLLEEILNDLATYQTHTNSSNHITIRFDTKSSINYLAIDNFEYSLAQPYLPGGYFPSIDEIVSII